MNSSKVLQVSLLVVASLVNIMLFLYSEGSILQVLWVYLVEATIVAALYYRRISTIRLAELAYRRQKRLKDLAKFEKEVRYQIPHEQFMFLFACILPLMALSVFVIAMSGNAITIVEGMGVETINMGVVPVNGWMVTIAGLAFFLYHYYVYRIDKLAAARGEASDRTRKIGMRAYLSIFPLFIVVMVGPFLFYYFGSVAMFAAFMALKLTLDVLLSVNESSM